MTLCDPHRNISAKDVVRGSFCHLPCTLTLGGVKTGWAKNSVVPATGRLTMRRGENSSLNGESKSARRRF